MNKTAVIYDKWLTALGGAELVACIMANVLKNNGYEVTFICKKKVAPEVIKEKLNVDVTGINFLELWNDEAELEKITKNKGLFLNISFMDYSYGYAKKNIYYVHFPTESYINLKSYLANTYILPVAAKIIKPVEFINQPQGKAVVRGRVGHLLGKDTKTAFYYLDINKEYDLRFSLFLKYFAKSLLEKIIYKIDNATIIKKSVSVEHQKNMIHFHFKIRPQNSTVYLSFVAPNETAIDRIFLLNLLCSDIFLPDFLYKYAYEKIENRLRAGVYKNIFQRLNTYQTIITHSEFVRSWITKRWQKSSTLLYPPVELLFEKYNLHKINKKNWICSVGRFFTLGHGKKQEVLIHAFKKIYNYGYRDWELHLVGGVGHESSSLEFIKYLQKEVHGYPIYFHFNADRKEVEHLLLQTKIYWHATGFGENEYKQPIRFEHFGIAPVEAISSHCIPVLYDGGGLKEIIRLSNFSQELCLFTTTADLIDKTRNIIDQPPVIDWPKIEKILIQEFSLQRFRKKFLRIVNR